MITLRYPILLLSLVAMLAAATATTASAATTTTSRVTWGQTGWSCAVGALAPVPTGNGYGMRHSDGFASCLKSGVSASVAHVSLITCLQASVPGGGWRSLRCSTVTNASGTASVDANVTQSCGAGYHRLRTQVTATALQPTLSLVARSATATSAVVGCRG